MTNLTEKWKKGELPEGWYYVKGSRAEGIYAYTAEYLNNMYRPRNGERIVEQVPSYEEWKDIKEEWKDIKDDLATCDKDLNNVCEQKEELYEENSKLKELLKRCKRHINASFPYIYRELLQEINQVLGEE